MTVTQLVCLPVVCRPDDWRPLQYRLIQNATHLFFSISTTGNYGTDNSSFMVNVDID